MKTLLNSACVGLTIITCCWGTWAGQPKPAPSGPVPNPIVNAKKVFIANAGGDEPWDSEAQFTGGPERAYDEFYAAMKSWGHYELVNTPGDADLWFEIAFRTPALAGTAARTSDSLAGRPYDPQFRLTIRDPKTNAVLWAFTEHVQWAVLQGNRDKNFSEGSARIVADVQGLAARSAAGSSAVQP
jgi:hypothetical protein